MIHRRDDFNGGHFHQPKPALIENCQHVNEQASSRMALT